MAAKPKKEKAKRKRRVFGRVKVAGNGKDCVIWMDKTAIYCRPKHAHRVWSIPIRMLALTILTNGAPKETKVK